MTLHKNKKLFTEAVRFTAQQKGILDIYIEKDYWITYALHLIFKHEIGKETVFKGGTSLNKCFNVIERFSEDIDLVILQKSDETGNQLKSKLKKIGKVVESELPEIKVDNLTHKTGMNRKTVHVFPKIFEGNYGQIRKELVIEATWFGNFEPYKKTNLSSFIYEMMLTNKQLDIAKKYDLLPFEINVLEVTRTFCEKIMSLIRFSYSKNPITNLKLKIRHAYDLHLLLKLGKVNLFFNSNEFDKMLIKVANEDMLSFKNNNDWLNFHPKEALIFRELESVWSQLIPSYKNNFSNLVYGVLPNEKDIFKSLNRIKSRIEKINYSPN